MAAGGEGPLGLAHSTPRKRSIAHIECAGKDFQWALWVASVHAGSEPSDASCLGRLLAPFECTATLT